MDALTVPEIVISNREKMGLRKPFGPQNIRTYEVEGDLRLELRNLIFFHPSPSASSFTS
jgi:hypothetical protein